MTMGELNEDRKGVYPLFQKVLKAAETKSDEVDVQTPPQISELPSSANTKKASSQKGRKPKQAAPSKNGGSMPTMPQELQNARAELLEVDLNDGRKKRRKTASPVDEARFGVVGDNSISGISGTKHPQGGQGETLLEANEIAAATERSKVPDSPLNLEIDSRQNSGEGSTTNHSQSLIKPPTQSQQPAPPPSVDSGNSEPPGTAHLPATTPPTPESNSTDRPLEINSTKINSIENKPKKILRWNPKTGTIGSPPPKKSLPPIESTCKTSTPTAAGRRKSRIVTIRYGHGYRLSVGVGLRINQILTGSKPVSPFPENPATIPTDITPGPVNGPDPAPPKKPKAIHPLFMGKAASKSSNLKDIITTRSKSTEVTSPQRSKFVGRTKLQSQEGLRPLCTPSELAFSGFGKSNGILKFPGAVEPAWPWKGMVHVRGDESPFNPMPPNSSDMLQLQLRPKKSKYQAVEVLEHEDVIAVLSKTLNINDVLGNIRKLNPDEFPPSPACLRVPTRHYEGGSALQRRVRKELRARIPIPKPAQDSSSEEELQQNGATQTQTHPALTKIYNLIATSLSAFDQGQCETQTWTQKYSPNCAPEVLQSGREALILKDWLQTLTVKSVETGAGDKSRSRGSSVSKVGLKLDNKKRKRKTKKLDGFVVSSDEEDDDMDELTDAEDDVSSLGGSSLLKKTVIRAGDTAHRGNKEPPRLINAVVVSGPHGCGKSASIYAVAKELGFEIFEINSGSRRSGKDILEKVGDMTRNHLVQQSHSEVSVDDENENEQVDEALARDLKTGRQGTMNSFFKPKQPTNSKTTTPKRTQPSGKTNGKREDVIPKAPAKQQKQSLILIEEADIIFEEDKQFWATILSLVAQSKRPIIITCNDESTIPLSSLSLHAIIRFNPPPVDLAVDYMLLVAACEGHIIQRNAVTTLYESRNLDLRASLMELNLWCQFAVGDCKSGLDWFLPRWPKGNDINEDGETIRVVSEGTYETGMGWLSQDNLESHAHYLDIEEEMLHEAWDGWHLDAGDWQKTIPVESWAAKTQEISNDKRDERAALEIYDEFTDAISAADLCSGSAFAPHYQMPIDATLPTLSTKLREDYVLAHDLLEASPLVDFKPVTKEIALWMKSRARKYMQVDQHVRHSLEVPAELDSPSEGRLIQLIAKQVCKPESRICRRDFSLAFDPISEPEKPSLSSTSSLEASSFDRTITMISTDLAPYVRSIVLYDARLQQDRARMSNLLSEGGRKGKRMRTTRAAISALEGGARSTTRRDRYFGSKLNPHFVLKTGGENWPDAALADEKPKRRDGSPSKGSGGCLGSEQSSNEYDELGQEDDISTDQKSGQGV
ncbi:uncharacterized protein BP5553_03805 [Venustampulla echinocandica]|uniref:ATPase AAA-type core domain-containing protein n=1 Tax=Venustampulla echinocandica TaxID=2656787 RepID=A0A370TV99_9HELO|nr:uncharacterized protein BP5553_03805 [Venustampulla echinocandica]RDL39465.1 hypothetical protein BP5553_03805 [Venustampulla echinocandica]